MSSATSATKRRSPCNPGATANPVATPVAPEVAPDKKRKKTAKQRREEAAKARAEALAEREARQAAKQAAEEQALEAGLKAFVKRVQDDTTPLSETGASVVTTDYQMSDTFCVVAHPGLLREAVRLVVDPIDEYLLGAFPLRCLDTPFGYRGVQVGYENTDVGNQPMVYSALRRLGRPETEKAAKELVTSVVALLTRRREGGPEPKPNRDAPVRCTIPGLLTLRVLQRGFPSGVFSELDYTLLLNAVVAALAFGHRVFTDNVMLEKMLDVMGIKDVKDDDDDDDDDDDHDDEYKGDIKTLASLRSVLPDAIKRVCMDVQAQ
jgi:hypothetical protein